jgi:hypothetical protein
MKSIYFLSFFIPFAINDVCLNFISPLGIFFVKGLSRVPRPAAIIKA